MWLKDDIVVAVNKVANIRYISAEDTQKWNKNRSENELRMFTGWCWVAKNGVGEGQGLKTMTCCYRDCWYKLVAKQAAPSADRRATRAKLRVIENQRKVA